MKHADFLSFEQICLMDKSDSLSSKRDEFALPSDKVYLDGNSLGAQPKNALARAKDVIEKQWGEELISSWNVHNWIDLPSTVGDKVGRLIGAAPGQTVCCDSISVNLFKLLSAAITLQTGRTEILSVSSNFPTDLYIAQGLEQLLGEQCCQLKCVEHDRLLESLSDETAVLMLTQVDFRSGQILDMQSITQAAHQKGILVLWDLAHSAGAIEVELDKCAADFAVGCGYKYLNGGPGAPAFLYINQKHIGKVVQPLYGWMGHDAPFQFNTAYQPAKGIEQALVGTPSIIAMSTLDAALDVFNGLTMAQLRSKSQRLSELFLALLEQYQLNNFFNLVSPQCPSKRGSQLALAHQDAYAICQALIEQGVIADFRAPDILRFGFAPLYNSYADIYQAVTTLKQIIEQQTYRQERFQVKSKVT